MKNNRAGVFIAILGIGMLITNSALAFETLGKDCKSYARALFAVAEARDNLDEPSIEELKKLHPILQELEDTGARDWVWASLINLRIINKKRSPKTLMMNSYENCISGGGLCSLYGKGCPK